MLTLLFLPLAGCATKRDLRTLQATIQETHAQNQALLRELQRDQGVQQDSLRALSRTLQDMRGDMAGGFAELESEIALLQEITGVNATQLATFRDDFERSRASAAAAAAQGGGVAGGESAADLFAEGRAHLNNESFLSAEMAFEALIDEHPGDPLVADARFFRAQSIVEQGDRERAIEAFLLVQSFHPQSPRTPEALYRVGKLYLELGNRTEGESYLRRVVQSYGGTGAAQLASEELRNLR